MFLEFFEYAVWGFSVVMIVGFTFFVRAKDNGVDNL